ncbi:SOS response-associated peptidase [Salinibacterium sp. UTAS2018]|uniref:SOS response-associated peptidase n=1 Tax=Salinibacterium sp. UTAS2018 TaxID=2508880 RepID=UPI0010095065|nr:SOS response-associated peptidase [Salinibacterium sp. UTAS2018]QAV69648.1 SOS response-associated peptidase [Salinibacterium sp. UTAS2018]
MCGRFAMDDTVNQMITEFVTATGRPPEEWQADWLATPVVRPTDPVPILLTTLADRDDPSSELVPRAALAQWWLTPPFSPVLRGKYPTFNARSETVTEKPTFRSAIVNQRAVLPAIGYFETQKSGPTPVPYYITPPSGLLFFAGLYSWWKDPAADADDPARWHLTTTMLTQQATGALADIHDRMPVILDRDSIDTWIDPRTRGDRLLVEATVAASATLSEQLHAEPQR